MRRLLAVLALLAACSSDSDPPLTDATSLHCPAPGALPFRLSSDGFRNASNETLAASNPRIKDEASDTIGGSVTASVYLPDDQAPSAGAIHFRGAKARSRATGGGAPNALAGETVSLWTYDASGGAWQALGTTTTGSDGYYDLAATDEVPNGQPVYAMLEADGSCAEHYDYVLPAGSKVVVSDIDGTLTLDDTELIKQVGDASYVPKLMTGGDHLLQAWANKGYPIVYLTARPHELRAESRGWLTDLGFPTGPLITTNGGSETAAYKTLWLERMTSFGWDIVAAYGNADTDITAYANAGIPLTQTFIVGPLAGQGMTQPIANMDFGEHIATYVAAQPANAAP